MEKVFLVFVGGGAGAVLRYAVGVASLRTLGSAWPYGTFLVNVIGGLAMGVLVAVLALRGGADQERWRVLLAVGVLGGFTTFSAFSLEVAKMIETKAVASAALYASASVAASVGALFLGMMLARRVFA